MSRVGELAPDFTLPGVENDRFDTYSLREAVDRNRIVLLVFYPFDFSPVCTNELCAIRDAEWFELTPGVEVWAVSGDSAYSHASFAEEYDLNFTLLSDNAARVAGKFDVQYESLEGHEKVPKRAVFLIDSDRTIRYRWHTDDAYEKPDFFPVKEALDELAETREDLDADGVDFAVEYDEGPGRLSR